VKPLSLCLLLLVLLGTPNLLALAAQEHHHHETMSNESMSNVPTEAESLKILADKKESEFNHHLAGFFVVLGGVFMLTQGLMTPRWPFSRYVWPASFFLSGIFVLVWSDTELWPFGPRHWLEALRNNPEVLQHKLFSVLLLGLGVIEYLRVKGSLDAVWSRLVFPVLAFGGSVLLLFHQHEGGMHDANHMQVMARIQSEHLSYATVGMGIGLTKALAEIRTRGQRVFAVIWPLLMVSLGILLMFYRE
jgi:hypothetical protein